jgi:hypothetical protein
MTFVTGAPGVFWGARNEYANVNSARLPPIFASARSFAPFGRRQSRCSRRARTTSSVSRARVGTHRGQCFQIRVPRVLDFPEADLRRACSPWFNLWVALASSMNELPLESWCGWAGELLAEEMRRVCRRSSRALGCGLHRFCASCCRLRQIEIFLLTLSEMHMWDTRCTLPHRPDSRYCDHCQLREPRERIAPAGLG